MKKLADWKKYIAFILVILIALTVLFLKVPFYYQARSYALMYPYSLYEKNKGLLKTLDIPIAVPGGSSTQQKDWYPFMLVFNDDQGFSQYQGRDLALTILYNFGAFAWNSSSSSFFQQDSPYFNSFYGAYIVKENGDGSKEYGYTAEGNPDIDEIFELSRYDFLNLVLKSFGCPDDKLTMEILSHDVTTAVEYAGYKDWVRIDSLLLLNSPEHRFRGDRRAYIQYGNPLKKDNIEEFRLVTSNGRIYMRYFEEYQSTIFLYIMSPYSLTLEKTEEEILSKTTIGKNT